MYAPGMHFTHRAVHGTVCTAHYMHYTLNAACILHCVLPVLYTAQCTHVVSLVTRCTLYTPDMDYSLHMIRILHCTSHYALHITCLTQCTYSAYILYTLRIVYT